MLVKRLFIILSIASLCLAVRGDFDISNLNPLKWPMNFVRVVVRSFADKEMGVWFVRRPLKNMGIGITFGSGTSISFYHYGIVIDNKLYHVLPDSKTGSFSIKSEIMYDCLADTFTWFRAIGRDSARSRKELDEFANRYESRNFYNVIPGPAGQSRQINKSNQS